MKDRALNEHKKQLGKEKHNYGLWAFMKDTTVNIALIRALYLEMREYAEKSKKIAVRYAPEATSSWANRLNNHQNDAFKWINTWSHNNIPGFFTVGDFLRPLKSPIFIGLTTLAFYSHFKHTTHNIDKSSSKFFRSHEKQLIKFVDYHNQFYSPENGEIYKK